jgi:Cu2+-containing amine oxidase
MSDIDTYDGGNDVDYGHYEAGEQHDALDQLHQASGSESDYNNQYAVYEQDHAAAENTSFDQGRHVEIDNPGGGHYEQTDYTSYDHSAAETDHVFAAEGSESSHQAEFSELDALRERFDTAFAEGTEFHGGDYGVAAK